MSENDVIPKNKSQVIMTEKIKRLEISKKKAEQVQKINPVKAYVVESPSLSTSIIAPSSEKMTNTFLLSNLTLSNFIGKTQLQYH